MTTWSLIEENASEEKLSRSVGSDGKKLLISTYFVVELCLHGFLDNAPFFCERYSTY